jgi:hypothetical protein
MRVLVRIALLLALLALPVVGVVPVHGQEAGEEAGADAAAAAEAEAAQQAAPSIGDALTRGLQQAIGEIGEDGAAAETGSQEAVAAQVEAALASADPDVVLEGQAAQIAQEAGQQIVRFQAPIGENGAIGEIDVETERAIIETTNSPSGKLSQIQKEMTNTAMNPGGKPVVLYAPNYTVTAGRAITDAGAYLARTPEELTDILSGL